MIDYHQPKNMPVGNDGKETDIDSLGQKQFLSVHIFNNTAKSLSLVRKNLEWGRWVIEPPSFINPHSEIYFRSRGTLFGGIEGDVEYSIFNGSFKFYWSDSFWGVKDYRLTVNDPRSLYNMHYKQLSWGVEVYVNEKTHS